VQVPNHPDLHTLTLRASFDTGPLFGPMQFEQAIELE
jgi:hypothetical protein